MEENEPEAVEWFRRAAGRGQSRALFLLGECYEEGNGVQADLEKAREYYQQAAERGYKSAQEALERLNGGAVRPEAGPSAPSSSYAYQAPAPQHEPPAPPAPAAQRPPKPEKKEKPKKKGLFGFFKK